MNVHQEILELKKLVIHISHLQKKILLHHEAASYMGISKSYLYKLGYNDKIPVSSPEGKLKYYRREDLDAYMLSGMRKSKQQIINEIS